MTLIQSVNAGIVTALRRAGALKAETFHPPMVRGSPHQLAQRYHIGMQSVGLILNVDQERSDRDVCGSIKDANRPSQPWITGATVAHSQAE